METACLAGVLWAAIRSVRLAGAAPDHLAEAAVFAATPADVRHVVISGRKVADGGRHLLVEDVPAALAATIAAVTG